MYSSQLKVNIRDLKAKASSFGELVKKFREEDGDKYLNYLRAFVELVTISHHVFNVEVTITNTLCILCGKNTKDIEDLYRERLMCEHYICSADCGKQFILKCWKDREFDLGNGVCSLCDWGILGVESVLKWFGSREAFCEWVDEQLAEISPEFQCAICNEGHKAIERIRLECDHYYCLQTLKNTVRGAKENGDFDGIPCPDCAVPITPYVIQLNLTGSEWEECREVILKGEELKEEMKEFNCPKCHKVNAIRQANRFVQCPECRYIENCENCQDVHLGVSCEKSQQWKEGGPDAGWSKCPRCTEWDFKSWDANVVICSSFICKRRTFYCSICRVELIVTFT